MRGENAETRPILQTLFPGEHPHLTLPSPLPPGAERESLHQLGTHCAVRSMLCFLVAAVIPLSLNFPATAETIDFGTVLVGSRIVREKKESFRWYWFCNSERFDGALLNPNTRLVDNSPPFAFDGSSSFTLRSCFGDKDSGYFKIAFTPATPGQFTRLLRIRTSFGGEESVTLVARGEDPPPLQEVHVDWQYTAPNSDGSLERPYRTVARGYERTTECGTLKIRTGHYAGRMLLTKCIRLEAYAGPVELGGPGQGGLLVADDGTDPASDINPGVTTAQQPLAVTRRTDGAVVVTFHGPSNQRYQVLSSTNLVDWTVWNGLDAEEGSVVVGFPKAADEPMRFFKVVEVDAQESQ